MEPGEQAGDDVDGVRLHPLGGEVDLGPVAGAEDGQLADSRPRGVQDGPLPGVVEGQATPEVGRGGAAGAQGENHGRTALVALSELEKDQNIPPGSKFETFAWADRLLGLDLVRDVGRIAAVEPLPDGAQEILDWRAAARTAKDWAVADSLRDELAGLGVAVTDGLDGQSWSVT